MATARLLAAAVNDRTRQRFDEHEAFLVDQLAGVDVNAAKVVVRYWQRLTDSDGPDPGDRSRNRVSMTKGWDDRWHLDADLDPVTGAVVKAVLDALVDRMHADGRFADRSPTHAQQQAEALEEMANRSTGAGPGQQAVPPDIVVVVPVERLTEPEPDPLAPPPVLIGTGPVTLGDVMRLAVLGHVSKMTVDGGRPPPAPRPPAPSGQR